MSEMRQFLIYQSEDGELDKNSVIRFSRTTAADGKQYEVGTTF